MKDDAQDALRSLVWGTVEDRVAQGDAAYAHEVGSRLAARYAAAQERARDDARSLSHVVRVLALTPGRENVVQLLRLLDDRNAQAAHGGLQPRSIASLLARSQSVADLVDTVFDRGARDRHDELRDCLFHELVLRGVAVEDFRPLRYWSGARPGWHALSWLPAHRCDFEAGADFGTVSIHGGSCAMPTGLPAEGRVDPPTPRTAERSALRDVATARVQEAVISPAEAGNWGDSAAWVFRPDEAVAPEQVPALLPTLPMACVEGLGPTGRFEIAVRPLDAVWRLLFATASLGGLYASGGYGGAYARLAAWHSMAALSGAPAGASAAEAEQYARQSTWFHFESDAAWFHNEIYDYGIAALSPDRRRIAVLAATDTD
ncbi:DUF6183 family protein [Streptomyces sp. NPDC046215]|uniref:DUF4240 domain-containing protein n=1 Tax=Streptomyces stramineus TaxID=173861 RepID=A0ABN0ZMD9_9ACTN